MCAISAQEELLKAVMKEGLTSLWTSLGWLGFAVCVHASGAFMDKVD